MYLRRVGYLHILLTLVLLHVVCLPRIHAFDEENPEKCVFKCLDEDKCITKDDMCDSVNDCEDGSDESNCTRECLANEFKCADESACIAKTFMCDGSHDCFDGSDEQICDTVVCKFDDDFACMSTGQCISGSLKCDGTQHCPDGSDEHDCQYTCKENEFNCTEGTPMCISMDLICDGHNNCFQGHDELNCNMSQLTENSCEKENGGCSHKCVVHLIGGHHCECPQGYSLASDHLTCHDIDECESHHCSHDCQNTDGSYACQCNHGYQLADDAHTCLALAPEPYLFVTNSSKLLRIGLHSETEESIEVDGTIISIDGDVSTGQLYIIQLHKKQIFRVLFGGAITPLITEHLEVPIALAFDWVHGNLYWLDAGLVAQKARIELMHVDTKMRTTILTAPAIQNPLSIAIDPRQHQQYIYWSQGGVNPGIYRAGLDGSQSTALVNTKIQHPTSIVLDFVAEKLYWLDSHENMISAIELLGEEVERSDLYSMQRRHNLFAGLASFEDWLYWVDDTTHKVKRMNRYDENYINFLFDYSSDDYSAKSDLVESGQSLSSNKYVASRVTYISHPLRQIQEENVCVEMNGNCSHVCIASATYEGVACFCPNPPNKQSFYQLDNLKKTCLLQQETTTKLTPTTPQFILTAKPKLVDPKMQTILSNEEATYTGWSSTITEEASKSASTSSWIYVVVAIVVLLILALPIIAYKIYKRREEKKMLFENPMFEPLKKDQTNKNQANKSNTASMLV